MPIAYSEALARLRGRQPDLGRYPIGSAWFDEEHYDRLGEQFDEAVRALSQAHGVPLPGGYAFPGLHVEKSACWDWGDGVVYAVLTWEDNTRQRTLTLGCCLRGELRSAPPPATDWWSQPPL